MKKVKVDEDKCIGCGLCINLCPEVFEFNKNNKSQVKAGADLEKNKECIKESIQSCPVVVISGE